MKFIRALAEYSPRVFVLRGDQALALPKTFDDVADLARAGTEGLRIAHEIVKNGAVLVRPVGELDLLPPIRVPDRNFLCCGWNYWDHFAETEGQRKGLDVERPTAPTFFSKSPGVLIGPRDDIALDPELSEEWDYEAELAVVLGRGGRSINKAAAMDHVFGFTLANDVSVRELQRDHGQWFKGKSIDGTMPLGPVVVTPDEIDLQHDQLICCVNGQEVQNARLGQMAFKVPEILEHLSLGMSLFAGDCVLTGTPSGVGMARSPKLWLRDGDLVEIDCGPIGKLSNRVRSTDLHSYRKRAQSFT